ncbi:MAG: hypothetical protein Q9216_003061 [Gyalolechia sp. 2 TL-2023]
MNASSLTAWLDGFHPIKPGQTTIVYDVPGTSTRLLIEVWNERIPQMPMSVLLLRTINYAATHINEKGDGTIEFREDPFWLDSKTGVIFGLWSTDPRRHLTYSELSNTARGIWAALYRQQKYNAARISVYDKMYTEGRTKIGYGVIRSGHLRMAGSLGVLGLPEMS